MSGASVAVSLDAADTDSATEFDINTVAGVLMDNANCISEGLMCADCERTARVIVRVLRTANRLGPSPGTVWTYRPEMTMSDQRWFDLAEDDPDVAVLLIPLRALGYGEWALEFAQLVVSRLRKYGRMKPQTVELSLPPHARKLLVVLEGAEALRFKEKAFPLSGGGTSHFYANLRLVTDPEALYELSGVYAFILVEEVGADNFEVVFGPAMAAISLATVVCQALWRDYGLHKQHTTMRPEVKEYGMGGRMVGASVSGKRVVMVDDVMTTSATKVRNWEGLQEEGGILVATVVGLERTSSSGVIEEYERLTGAPFFAAANLNTVARDRGYESWESCEENLGRRVHRGR